MGVCGACDEGRQQWTCGDRCRAIKAERERDEALAGLQKAMDRSERITEETVENMERTVIGPMRAEVERLRGKLGKAHDAFLGHACPACDGAEGADCEACGLLERAAFGGVAGR